jgi:hypothetical protein
MKRFSDANITPMKNEQDYVLINTSKGNDPAVVVVDVALAGSDKRPGLSWQLEITVYSRLLGQNGMPTAEEVEVLNLLEDEFDSCVGKATDTAFFARATFRGLRRIVYRIQDPEPVDDLLQELASNEHQTREWEYRIEHDPDWTLTQPEIELAERASRCRQSVATKLLLA